jgi:hypothetical protein
MKTSCSESTVFGQTHAINFGLDTTALRKAREGGISNSGVLDWQNREGEEKQ